MKAPLAPGLAALRPAGAGIDLGAGVEVILHSENGILGMGPAPAPGAEDFDLIDAVEGFSHAELEGLIGLRIGV